jgi:uncharacterized protein (TIGR04551 family)
MSRPIGVLCAALILVPALAGAQTGSASPGTGAAGAAGASTGAASPSAGKDGAALPGTVGTRGAGSALGAPAGTGATPELDPAVRELVKREVEKAKEEMRDEVRAEIQGAQSAKELMETAGSGDRPKLDLLQLNGYLRVRGDLLDNLDLRRAVDPSGYFLFPRPFLDQAHRGTITSANMRFRLEPTLNVSEQVRVLAQVDMLDDIVLGSTPEGLYARSDRVPLPFGATTQVPPVDGVNADRSSIAVKRAWGEVQTPVGLLSFGRMPSSWGLGILSHAGAGLDDDFGDTVDRLQFALTPLRTPLGPLVLVPMYEIVATGVTSQDVGSGRGLGQPFDRDQADDAKAIGLKIVRMDTDEEMKRKHERGEGSFSFGAWYMYKSQGYEAQVQGNTTVPSEGRPTDPTAGSPAAGVNTAPGAMIRRDAYAHTLDLWTRWQTKRFRLEAEFAGIIGQIGNVSNDPANPVGPVLLRQFGGTVQAAWKLADGKLTLGGEVGMASGDSNPGMGNQPGRGTAGCEPDSVNGGQTCNVEGAQYRVGDRVLDIRNFRFNQAYRVDMVLWREILGGVTDAWYLKPNARYEIFEGLSATLAVIYSQAMYASSTPSGIHAPLGLEADLGLQYRTDDGFQASLAYGVLQPLDGLGYQVPNGRELTRGHALRAGLAIKF